MNYKANADGELSPVDLPVGDKTVVSKYTVSPDKQYKNRLYRTDCGYIGAKAFRTI
ncbi:MAG: hypothetical protein L6V93_04680 [Clostridiales bacterium]|nr:MAG: hypothetical protein L6V93_04680 [Clostridiales bacterium]